MALTGIRDVFNGLFLEFIKGAEYEHLPQGSRSKHPFQTLGTGTKTLVRYFLRGGDKGLEEVAGYYPVIVIQDFAPTVDRENVFSEEFISGYFDPTTGMVEKVYLPVPMEFKYQISAVSNNFSDKLAMYDWMAQRFDFTNNRSLEFNRVDTPMGMNADIVQYSVVNSEVPRDDGRFEYVFDFTLKAFIHFKAKGVEFEENGDGELTVSTPENFAEAVEQIKVSLYNKDFTTFEKVLTNEFIIK